MEKKVVGGVEFSRGTLPQATNNSGHLVTLVVTYRSGVIAGQTDVVELDAGAHKSLRGNKFKVSVIPARIAGMEEIEV